MHAPDLPWGRLPVSRGTCRLEAGPTSAPDVVKRALVWLVILTASTAPGRAEDWPRWRGPAGNGVSSERSLPVHWSATDNVRWKTAIPGEGFSSPVVCGERAFVTSAFAHGERRALHCLDRGHGTLLWSREVRDRSPERTSASTGYAAATPGTDGRRVVAFFGNAGAVCYDPDGRLLWRRELGSFDTELGLASSPVLDGGRVFLVCDHDGDRFTSFDSFLIALDLDTGKTLWKTDRPGLFRSWSTPILVPGAGGKTELVVSGQEQLRGYDPETGKELWRAEGLTGWVAPSPVFGHGLVFATSGRDGPTLAVRSGGRVVWRQPRGGPYVCSPVLSGDFLYVPDERGIITCYEAATGTLRYRERLGGKFTASPVAGDGKVYCTNEAGTTFVLKAGPHFEVLARNELREDCLASAAVSGGQLFLRTEHHLFCIGAPGGGSQRWGRTRR
jgi:outer membrane protein assembly factor BamB